MNARAAEPSVAQALVVEDSHRRHVRHILGHATPMAGLRHFLLRLRDACPVTWAGEQNRDRCHVALGLTYAGLLELPVPRHVRLVLRQRATAFCEGAAARAAQRLDCGANAPRWWDEAFDAQTLRFVLTLHADDEKALDRATEEVRHALGGGHPVVLKPIDGAWIDCPHGEEGQWVHFGLRDGLSHLRLRGHGRSAAMPDAGVVAGELLLGHPREHGDNPWLLARQRSQLLRELFRDGSFGVLRKIEQDVARFEAHVQQVADALERQWPFGQPTPEDWPAYVKAKFCGRWPDGRAFGAAPWVAPAGAKNAPPEDLDFTGDPQGLGCPFGAHVRRLNPRTAGTESPDAVVHARLRVLARRGRPYGPANWEGRHDRVERGLLGLFFCASLEDQFEHLLGHWADAVPLGLPDRGRAKDPLAGAHEDPAARFDIPLPGRAAPTLPAPPAFVRTRGTAYAFYPGRRGLQLLLEDRDLLDHDADEPLP